MEIYVSPKDVCENVTRILFIIAKKKTGSNANIQQHRKDACTKAHSSVEYYLAMKKSKPLLPKRTWMKLTDIC